MDLETDSGAIYGSLKTEASGPSSTTVLASVLAVGDLIVGADDREFLIESIDVTTNEHGLILYAVSEAGDNVKTEIPRNAYVHRVERLIKDGEYGLKICVSCDQQRSARHWTDDDYLCKVCRHGLEEA